jgi:hypothetical protein
MPDPRPLILHLFKGEILTIEKNSYWFGNTTTGKEKLSFLY